MRISRIEIRNFRNFDSLDVALSGHAVIVGENKIGKSNLLHALRLVLDPSLPDVVRQLREEDFWDGLPRPLTKDDVISVALEFADFEDDDNHLAILGQYPISQGPLVAKLTYVFGPKADADPDELREADYEFFIYGGDDPENQIGPDVRRRLPVDYLSALRDAEGDLANWRRSPLRPLLEDVATKIERGDLEEIAEEISEATKGVTDREELSELAKSITNRLTEMVGKAHALDISLGFSPTEASRLLRALRLFIDSGTRSVSEASLGSANLLYLVLKMLELEQLVASGTRNHTFLAIEEPEAHLHPHLQRLVYRDFLSRRSHQEGEAEPGGEEAVGTTIYMTTHSPHIVSVSPLDSIVLLRKTADRLSTEGVSSAQIEFDDTERRDLERYLDVTRGEMLFSKGVLLVEGDAELFLVPILGKLLGFDFDELGITVCSVAGTNFAPYVRFLGPKGLKMPFAVLTDFDPTDDGGNLGEKRVVKLIPEIIDAARVAGKPQVQVLALARKNGIFLNEHTLEVDLFKCRPKGTTSVLIELSDSGAVRKRAKAWQDQPTSFDAAQYLSDIKAIGKGRFAQRLATQLKTNRCPPYISEAISYVAERCR